MLDWAGNPETGATGQPRSTREVREDVSRRSVLNGETSSQAGTRSEQLLCPGGNQPEHDLVMTPPELAELVVDYYRPTGRVLDPCRGDGAFCDALMNLDPRPAVVDWCEITEGRDFLDHDVVWRKRRYDYMISNPPWSKLRQFLIASMQIADNVVFLATVTHFVTRARLRDIRESGFGIREVLLVDHPPPPWPVSGFQLAAVHVQRGFVSQTFTDVQSASREGTSSWQGP